MKHLFFLGLGVSPLPSSLLEEATGVGLEEAGWFTTKHEERQQEQRKLISHTNFNYLLSDNFNLQASIFSQFHSK